jgi:urea transport system permease protein
MAAPPRGAPPLSTQALTKQRDLRVLRAFARSVLLAFALAVTAAPAGAQDLNDVLRKFAADSFAATGEAVSALAVSGAPQAGDIIAALQDGRLLFQPHTKAVVVKSSDGTLLDPRTMKPLAGEAPFGLKPVRLNNLVRSSIAAAMGALRLANPDPGKRMEGADAVFRSRDVSSLPQVEAALAREQNPDVRKTLELARAAIVFLSSDKAEAERIKAVDPIAARGDQLAIGLLRELPASAPAALKAAAAAAIVAIQRDLAFWVAGQNLWYGLSLGSVLLLAAIGLAITFGQMGVINMAHGEMVMLGAYTTYVMQSWVIANVPAMTPYALALSVPAAFLVAGAAGIAIERGIIRFLYGRPLETLLATWGVSLFLQQAVRTIFGPTNKEVSAPDWMSGAFQVGQLTITWGRLWIIVFALAVFAALLLVIRTTRFGLEMRAVTQNRAMASAMGVRTHWVDALTFGLGSGIAGIAGVALTQIDNVSPNLGQGYIIDSFLVVVFGGVGNLWGTLVGAFSLGIANKLLEPYAGAVLGKIVLLVLIVLFIQKRPRGLFALRGRALES